MTDPLPGAIRDGIHALLAQRAADATICPSDVARAIDPDGWRDLMDDVRAVAVDEAAHGRLEIRQGGLPAGGPPFQGPIRLARAGGSGRGAPGGSGS